MGLAGAAWFVLSIIVANIRLLISLIFSSPLVTAFVVVGVWIIWVALRRVFVYIRPALHPMWVRRAPKGALLHARWQAFRRYLTDFSRMEDSPPASLALWEQFLVYGIALGVAEQVLEAARLHAPAEVAQGGSFYSPGHDGYTSRLYDFSEAFAPPITSGSGSRGSGGWFGGSGGGFSGEGGGGGAW